MSSDSESVTIKSTSRASSKAAALKTIRDRFKTLRSDFDAKMKELEAAFTAEFKASGKKSASTGPKRAPTLTNQWLQFIAAKYRDDYPAYKATVTSPSMLSFAKHLKEVSKVDEYAEFTALSAEQRTAFVAETLDAYPKPEKPAKASKGGGRVSKKAAAAVIDEHEEEVLTSSNSSSSSAAAIPKASPVVAKTPAKTPVKRAKVTKVPKEWKLGGTTYMKNTDHQVWECSSSGLGDWVGLYDTKTKTIDTGVDEPARPVMSE